MELSILEKKFLRKDGYNLSNKKISIRLMMEMKKMEMLVYLNFRGNL